MQIEFLTFAKEIPQFCRRVIAEITSNHYPVIRVESDCREGWRLFTMTQVKDIRNPYFEEGRSVSEIARLTEYDQKTVSKYVKQEDWNEEIPSFTPPNQFPKLEPFKKARRRQRHTAQRVYDRLVEMHGEALTSSYSSVAHYVSVKKKGGQLYAKGNTKDLFLPMWPPDSQGLT